jgi:hypothetical protein
VSPEEILSAIWESHFLNVHPLEIDTKTGEPIGTENTVSLPLESGQHCLLVIIRVESEDAGKTVYFQGYDPNLGPKSLQGYCYREGDGWVHPLQFPRAFSQDQTIKKAALRS